MDSITPVNRIGLLSLLSWVLLVGGCTSNGAKVRATGTVELTQTDVAALVPARVVKVLVDEGQPVARGDTLVLLSVSTLPADIEQRRRRLAQAEAELRDLLAGARPQEIQRAAAELESSESEAERAVREAARLARLAEAGGISQSQLEAAQTAARVAAARRDALRQALDLLKAGARPERIRAARAAVEAARAQLAMGEASATDLVLTAPGDGVVLARYVEAGEVLAAGLPALSLGDPRRPWVRVYVPAAVVARIHTGQGAKLFLEGIPDQAFAARVVAIAPRAEFTPRVALTERERADLLFGVKLEIADSSGTVKAGLPATVVFDTAGQGRTARQ
jgi:HlyD family secretion protein